MVALVAIPNSGKVFESDRSDWLAATPYIIDETGFQRDPSKISQKGKRMKVLCLGGAGRICRESAYDMLEFADMQALTIADCDLEAGREAAARCHQYDGRACR